MITQVKQGLIETRTESAFRELISNAKTVAEEVDAAIEFPAPTRPRPRRRLFNYGAVDEPIADPETHFRVNFYYYLLDTAITKLDERFKLLNESNIIFSFLQNLNNWKTLDSEGKRAHCSNLQNKLSSGAGSNSDIDENDLFNEIELLPMFVDDCTTPLEILNYSIYFQTI